MAEVLINIDPKQAAFYDPDKHSPDQSVLVFPRTVDVPDGHRIKLQNFSTSDTDVIYRAQDSDTIADPIETTVFSAERTVGIPELLVEYMAVGTQWRLSGQADPDLGKNALQTFTYAAYGGLYLDAVSAAGTDIGAGWDTITEFDTVKFATPRGVVQNLTNSSLKFTVPGIYTFLVTISFEHNESNAGRQTNIRLYNLTDATGSVGIPIFIARNQPGTTQSVSTMFEIGASEVDKEFQLQIGNGDAITSVVYYGLEFSVYSSGEFRGTL